MGLLSSKLTSITFGNGANSPRIERGTIATSPFSFTGNDTGNSLQVDDGAGNGTLLATGGVWNALWNDYADFQLLNDKLEFGKCYFDTKDGARICDSRCQLSVIGIASDTFGMSVGNGANVNEVPIAVAGWVLAYVDQEYECGTPLTNDENGNLTAITREEKLEYPERIVALYKRKEMQEQWGSTARKVEVDGRHWVKIK
tara:strand:+ start:71646 stop:72245 length:600 start_codon:yes stop_codon:yes gene_type:complete